MRWVLLAAAALFFGLAAGGLIVFIAHDPAEPEPERADIVPLAPPAAAAPSEDFTSRTTAPSSLAMVAKLTPAEAGAAAAAGAAGPSAAAAGPGAAGAAPPPAAPELSALERSALKFKEAIRSS